MVTSAKWPLALTLLAMSPTFGMGQVSRAAREVVAEVLEWGAKQGVQLAPKTVSRLESLLATHADEILAVSRRCGWGSVKSALEVAGDAAPQALRLLQKHGPKVTPLIDDPSVWKLIVRHGDEAATALLKHPGVSAPVLEGGGTSAIRALNQLNARSGRRLAILGQEGPTASLARDPQILAILELYGDRAMDFVWKNQASLLVAGVLVTFVRDPQPYLDGVKSLGSEAVSSAGKLATTVGTHGMDRLAEQIPGGYFPLALVPVLAGLTLCLWFVSRVRKWFL